VFVLTYRGKPIARLEPVSAEALSVPDGDPLLRIEDFAVDGAGGVSNEDIDRLLYGS
jgi:hypothetical protein